MVPRLSSLTSSCSVLASRLALLGCFQILQVRFLCFCETLQPSEQNAAAAFLLAPITLLESDSRLAAGIHCQASSSLAIQGC